MERRRFLRTAVGLAAGTGSLVALAKGSNWASSVDGAAQSPNRQVAFAADASGIEPDLGHRLVEIGAVEIVDGRLTGRHLHSYLDPERDIDLGAEEVHRLSRNFLAGKPRFASVERKLTAFLLGSELLVHHASFVVRFLDAELSRVGASQLRRLSPRITDTHVLARAVHVGMRNDLDTLCGRYGIATASGSNRGALINAEAIARVYRLMTVGKPDTDRS